jgi:hypothetical protein
MILENFKQFLAGLADQVRFAILLPAYREFLSDDEELSLNQLKSVYPHQAKFLFAPESMPIPPKLSGIPVYRFKKMFFDGTDGYNNLMLCREFYETFSEFDYILIYQLDCLIFRSNIDRWCRAGWSYIGAPWFGEFWNDPKKGLWKTGNGGFSLRKVKDAIRVLDKKVPVGTMRGAMERASGGYLDTANTSNHFRKNQVNSSPAHGFVSVEEDLHRYPLNEDIFWSFEAERLDSAFKIPSARKALSFAFEKAPRWSYRRNWWRLPTGCHAWAKEDRSFWSGFIS